MKWTQEQLSRLKKVYLAAKCKEDIKLDLLAKEFGKLKSNISRKAKSLGLTNIARIGKLPENKKNRRKFKTLKEAHQYIGQCTKNRIKEKGHPKGMLGKHHNEQTKLIISKNTKKMNKSFSFEQKQKIQKKIILTKMENGSLVNHRPYTTWKSGWRNIGGKDVFYRSRWEANYARYLEWLKQTKQIKSWKHESKVFWFEGIKRGCVSYLPDFKVITNENKEEFHEVKGWMDDRSKTKIKRMAKYHPDVKLIIVKEKEYIKLEKEFFDKIDGWENKPPKQTKKTI